jgi:hypothetical protein
MERPPEYRSRAAKLRQQAAAAHSEHRGDFLRLADTYEELARQIEEMYARKKSGTLGLGGRP